MITRQLLSSSRNKPRPCVRKLMWTMVVTSQLLIGTSSVKAQQLNGTTISAAVERELTTDRSISNNNIAARLSEGVVTLSGTTDNLLAKERAELIAETVKGVQAVINLIDIEPAEDRTDQAIRDDVYSALQTDPATDTRERDVSVKDGVVTLSGTAQSWAEKQLSATIAKGVKGVTGLKNDIQIDYKYQRQDSQIKPEIEQALHWDVLIDDALIDVEVNDSSVTLTGIVGSAAEKRRAEYLSWVAGVTTVDNDGLEVARWARDTDLRTNKYVIKTEEEIKNAVQNALLYDPRVLSFNVTPKVTGSTVTLQGEVDNLIAARAAEEAAHNTVGVSAVKNHLTVRPAADFADALVAQTIRDTLFRNPVVDKYEISVGVTEGTAYLDGTVDSYHEKRVADELASRVNGVITVVNNLKVDKPAPFFYEPYVYGGYLYDNDWYDYEPIKTEMTDAEIKGEIKDEMWWSPFIDADDVTVSVDDGIATLTGKVDSVSEYHAAVENAYEGGAIYVKNRLGFRYE